MTKKQTSYFRGLSAQFFDGDDDYRDWLRVTFPRAVWQDPERPSCLDLSTGQGVTAIETIKALVEGKPVPKRGRYHGAGTSGFGHLLLEGQADEIERLQERLGWDDAALAGFVERQTGKRYLVSALPKRQASKLIQGMRRVLRDGSRTPSDA